MRGSKGGKGFGVLWHTENLEGSRSARRSRRGKGGSDLPCQGQVSRSPPRCVVVRTTLLRAVSALHGTINEKVHSPSFPANAGLGIGVGSGSSKYTGECPSHNRKCCEFLRVSAGDVAGRMRPSNLARVGAAGDCRKWMAADPPTDGCTPMAGMLTVSSYVCQPSTS